MLQKHGQTKNYLIFASIAIVALFFSFLISPLSLFSTAIECNGGEGAILRKLDPGDTYSYSFNMPFDKLKGLGIVLDGKDSPYVVSMDAVLSISDASGNVIASKKVTSVFDNELTIKDIKVSRGERYTVTFTVNDIANGEDIEHPYISLSSDSAPSFVLKGINSSCPTKAPYIIMYALTALIIFLAYKKYIKNEKETTAEKVLWISAVVFSVFLASQDFDYFMEMRASLRMIEAFKSGHFTDFVDYSYEKELVHQSSFDYFGYNYNFISVLITAIIYFPFSFITDAEMNVPLVADIGRTWMTVISAVIFYCCGRQIEKISVVCGNDKETAKYSKFIFLFSPLIIYCSITSGQIDLIYILMVLLALPFYFKRKLKTFSLIMSFAVAFKLLPLLIFIPLLLLVEKRIKEIVINSGIVLSVTAVTKVLFERGYGSSAVTDIMNARHSFMDLILYSNIGKTVNLFLLVYVAVVLWAYMKKIDPDDKKLVLMTSMKMVFVIYAAITVFVMWHTQWLIPLILSLAFIIPGASNKRDIIALMSLSEFLVILISNSRGVSIAQINYGLISAMTGHSYDGPGLAAILNNATSYSLMILWTAMAAILAYLTYVVLKDKAEPDAKTAPAMPLVFNRIIAIHVIILFYTWCFCFIS